MTPHRKKLLIQRFGQPHPSPRFEDEFVRFLKKVGKRDFKKAFFDEDMIAIVKDDDLVEFVFNYASGEFLSFIKELKERESDRGIWRENISIDDWLSSFFEKEIGNKLDSHMLYVCEKRDFDCVVDAFLKTVDFLDDSVLSSLGVFDVGVNYVSELTVEETLLLAELAKKYKQEKAGGFFDFALPLKGFLNKIDVPLKLAQISGLPPCMEQPVEELISKISEILSRLGDLKKFESDEESLEILNNFSMWMEKQALLMLDNKPEKGKSRNPRI